MKCDSFGHNAAITNFVNKFGILLILTMYLHLDLYRFPLILIVGVKIQKRKNK
jgi:hypothetical protein